MSYSGTSFSGKSFNVVNPGDKIQANISGDNKSLNISGEVKNAEYKEIPNQLFMIINNPIYNTNSFNQSVATNQSILQSFTMENILTISNNQNISNEVKIALQSRVKEFEEECNKSPPDQSKMKSILDFVRPISKDVFILLIKYALDKGIPLLFS